MSLPPFTFTSLVQVQIASAAPTAGAPLGVSTLPTRPASGVSATSSVTAPSFSRMGLVRNGTYPSASMRRTVCSQGRSKRSSAGPP